jgi:long-chain acyl-CoA synthetase
LGKIRRHLLPDRYDQAKSDTKKAELKGPLPVQEMSDQDQALLEERPARQVWDWLAQRYAEDRLTPDTDLYLDLGIDSLEWLTITLEIRHRTGTELKEEDIASLETARDLLRQVLKQSESGEAVSKTVSFDHPEDALSERQKYWLKPLGPGMSLLSRIGYGSNRVLTKGLFHLKTTGLDHLDREGQFIFVANHVSYLDPFVIAATFSSERLQKTYWAGWVGASFANPVNRFISRLTHTIPIDPEKGIFSSLAFAAAAIKRGHNLVWFPEGKRSPTGRLRPFKPGLAILLNHFDLPVVPVVVHGTYRAMPVGQFYIRPTPVKLAYGKPLTRTDLERNGEGGESRDRILNALHDVLIHLGAPH